MTRSLGIVTDAKSVHITDKLATEPLSTNPVVFQQLSETEVCPDISISDAPRPKFFSRKMRMEYMNLEDHVFSDTVCSKEHSLRETKQGCEISIADNVLARNEVYGSTRCLSTCIVLVFGTGFVAMYHCT